MKTARPAVAAAVAPRFPVVHAHITPDGTADLDGRPVDAGEPDPELAVLTEAATVAGWYGRQIRLNLTGADGRLDRLVVYPHGPVYTDRSRRATCRRHHHRRGSDA